MSLGMLCVIFVFYMNCTCDGVKSLLYVILEIKTSKERGPAESDWCDRGRKGKLGFSQRYSRQHYRSPAALHMYTQQEPCWHTPSAHLYRLLSRLPLTVWPSRLIHPLSLRLFLAISSTLMISLSFLPELYTALLIYLLQSFPSLISLVPAVAPSISRNLSLAPWTCLHSHL